jgi:hypothetical protein
MSDTDIKFPYEYIGSTVQLVTKEDGKKYIKRPIYRLSHYVYEPIEQNKIELPPKLADKPRNESK